ncbi:MAG: hypothetical protein ACYC27_05565 [Armatimonadota bacterium]
MLRNDLNFPRPLAGEGQGEGICIYRTGFGADVPFDKTQGTLGPKQRISLKSYG